MTKEGFSDRFIILLSLLVIAVWATPLWFTPQMTGVYDWGTAMHRYEAFRRTVLEFRQLPGHNPWVRGGQPLLGIPWMGGGGLLSIKGLCVLVFGTFWGLRLGVLIYLFIGFIGAWKLSGIWWKERFIRTIFAFYTTANPALIYHISGGHLVFQTFCFMPLLFYFLLRFRQDRWSGLKAAVVLAVAFNDSPLYVVQYGMLILGGMYIYIYLTEYKENSRKLQRWILLFIPVFMAATFYRTITILQIALDFPRISGFRTHYEWASLLKLYFYPYFKNAMILPQNGYCGASPEACSYVGIIAFSLTLFSLRRGFRWWHLMIILLIWAQMGNDSHFHIMYWVQKIPTFSSHRCFTRVRMFALLFFGIAATWGLSDMWTRYKNHNVKLLRYVAAGIGILMIAEVLSLSHLIMKSSHIKVPFWGEDNPSNKFQNVSSLPRPQEIPDYVLPIYRAIRMNLGWVSDYGESYLPQETARLGRDEPGYIAEFHQNGQPVEPVYWSPNRILFEGLDPNLLLVVNLNPGNPWYNNGKQLFPEYRIVEPLKPFEVMPDENGVVDLTYVYPGQRLGITGMIILLVISGLIIAFLQKTHRHRTPENLYENMCRDYSKGQGTAP